MHVVPSSPQTTCIGVISDTHDLLREEVSEAFQGCAKIIHAGDIGSAGILTDLNRIAPTLAVRGNNDKGAWAKDIPARELIDIEGVSVYVIHDLSELDLDPYAAGIRVVISGHSHRPLIRRHGGVLYLNPGSAGPRRFKLPISLARIEITAGMARSFLIPLNDRH